jgi:hypothetical protein
VASLDDDFVASRNGSSDAEPARVAPFRAEDDRFAAAVWSAFSCVDAPGHLDVPTLIGRVNDEAGDDVGSSHGASPTPESAFRIASVLFRGGARHEAYAVFLHGLSLESVDALTTEGVVELLPLAVLDGLAAEAEARGDYDIAGFLEAVAVVSAGL